MSIRTLVLDYLFCTGRGFHFDPEMIYDYEADYANLLRCVLGYIDGGDSSDLEVWGVDDADGSTVTIELRSDARSYSKSFGQERDWLNATTLDPIEAALTAETTQRLRCNWGGHEGEVLTINAEKASLVDTYL